MSARSASPRRRSRAEERPTVSGSTRGSTGCAMALTSLLCCLPMSIVRDRRSGKPRRLKRQLLNVLRPVHAHLEVPHQTVRERIDPAVHGEALAARPGVLHKHVRADIPHLPDDVELAQAVEAGLWARDLLERCAVLAIE